MMHEPVMCGVMNGIIMGRNDKCCQMLYNTVYFAILMFAFGSET
jgi:hypothetical protein